jgi:hypothetical protein
VPPNATEDPETRCPFNTDLKWSLQGQRDPLEVIKLKDLYGLLEDALDRCEDERTEDAMQQYLDRNVDHEADSI